MTERGFEVFVGETVAAVDTSSINVTHFHMASGKVVSVDVGLSHMGIYCPQVAEGYEGEPHWADIQPTHAAGWCEYARYKGRWYCFCENWQKATHEWEKWFESREYKPDDALPLL